MTKLWSKNKSKNRITERKDLFNEETIPRMIFRKFSSGNPITFESMREYLVDCIKKNDNSELPREMQMFIGTDSTRRGRIFHFATVIILYYMKSGGTAFYTKNYEPADIDTQRKLMREAEFSIAVAMKLNDICTEYGVDLSIHCDYSNNEGAVSNKIVPAALGYIKALGFNGCIKPHSFAASTAADRLLEA